VSAVASFFRFWYDFVIGDDWRIAAGVVLAVLGTWGLERAGIAAWWVLPIAVILLLAISLSREVRRSRRGSVR
jgi:hypothetical protein